MISWRTPSRRGCRDGGRWLGSPPWQRAPPEHPGAGADRVPRRHLGSHRGGGTPSRATGPPEYLPVTVITAAAVVTGGLPSSSRWPRARPVFSTQRVGVVRPLPRRGARDRHRFVPLWRLVPLVAAVAADRRRGRVALRRRGGTLLEWPMFWPLARGAGRVRGRVPLHQPVAVRRAPLPCSGGRFFVPAFMLVVAALAQWSSGRRRPTPPARGSVCSRRVVREPAPRHRDGRTRMTPRPTSG